MLWSSLTDSLTRGRTPEPLIRPSTHYIKHLRASSLMYSSISPSTHLITAHSPSTHLLTHSHSFTILTSTQCVRYARPGQFRRSVHHDGSRRCCTDEFAAEGGVDSSTVPNLSP